MSIRLNPNLLPDLLAAISQSEQNQNAATQQLASGRAVNQLSDNPAAVAALVGNHDQSSQDAQFLQNISTLQSKFQFADSAMSNVVTALTSAVHLATEGPTARPSPAKSMALSRKFSASPIPRIRALISSREPPSPRSPSRKAATPSLTTAMPTPLPSNSRTAIPSAATSRATSCSSTLPAASSALSKTSTRLSRAARTFLPPSLRSRPPSAPSAPSAFSSAMRSTRSISARIFSIRTSSTSAPRKTPSWAPTPPKPPPTSSRPRSPTSPSSAPLHASSTSPPCSTS